jgi:tRNA(adenine34) deaminase
MSLDEQWMRHALKLADQAEAAGEVPVGAVIIKSDELVGEGWNQVIGLNDPTAHAEVIAMRQAGMHLQNYRLPGCVLYVTLEPCCMCAGAIIHARFDRVVFGASDPKTGAAGSVFNLLQDERHNQIPEITAGCLESECSQLLTSFFRRRRQQSSA